MDEQDRRPDGPESPEAELRALALQALRALVVEGRLGAGDLIKVIGLESPVEAAAGRDFVIRLVED